MTTTRAHLSTEGQCSVFLQTETLSVIMKEVKYQFGHSSDTKRLNSSQMEQGTDMQILNVANIQQKDIFLGGTFVSVILEIA